MDFKALAVDAWGITRRTRALWWLGLVSAAQVVVSAVFTVFITGPLSAMPQLLQTSSVPFGSREPQLQLMRETARVVVTTWITRHGTALLLGIVVVFVLWIALGVLDVASQAGLITEAAASAEGRQTSFRGGMRAGFRIWGRVVGLLAIAALPSMFSMLMMGLIVFLTMTLPLLLGAQPNSGAALAGNVLLAPFSAFAALIGIPLGMSVQLGMRDAVLRDAGWREAFLAGWKLLKTHPMRVVVVYLLAAVIGIAVALCAGVVLAVVVVPSVAISFAVGGGSGATAITSGLFVLATVSVVLLVPMGVLTYVWGSCLWTLLWQRLTDGARTGLQ